MCNKCRHQQKQFSSRSRYSRADSHAPSRPATIIVQPMPRRSMFRDAAAVAGGVAVGSAVGNVAGQAITGMFSGHRREEVEREMPRNYTLDQAPHGPCAFEIASFLQCASNKADINECRIFNDALKDCKNRNNLD